MKYLKYLLIIYIIVIIGYILWGCSPTPINSIETVETTYPDPIPYTPTINNEPSEDNNNEDIEYYSLPKQNTPVYTPWIVLTDFDKEVIAKTVELEAGAENFECKCAIVSVIINRHLLQYHGKTTIYDLCTDVNQFSAGDRIVNNTVDYYPEDMQAVEYVIANGLTVDRAVVYFRSKHFWDWDNAMDYKQIDHTYFSYNLDLIVG